MCGLLVAARALGSIAESMLSVGLTWHDVEEGGTWGGPSVSAWGEAVVAPSVHLPFLIIVGIERENGKGGGGNGKRRVQTGISWIWMQCGIKTKCDPC